MYADSGRASWLAVNRLNWLPSKSALTGDQGTILHYAAQAGRWEAQTSPTPNPLFSIFGTSDGAQLWPVGDNGTIVHGAKVGFAPYISQVRLLPRGAGAQLQVRVIDVGSEGGPIRVTLSGSRKSTFDLGHQLNEVKYAAHPPNSQNDVWEFDFDPADMDVDAGTQTHLRIGLQQGTYKTYYDVELIYDRYGIFREHWVVTLVVGLFATLLAVTLILVLRSSQRILREREEKYPIWEKRIDRDFIGHSSVPLSFVPKRHRAYVIVRYCSQREDLETTPSEDAVVSANAPQIGMFNDAWTAASLASNAQDRNAFANATVGMTDVLCERLGFRRGEISRYHNELQAVTVYAPSFRINVPSDLAFVFLKSAAYTTTTTDDMVDLMKLLGFENRYFGVAFPFGSSEQLRSSIRGSGPYRSDFVVLDRLATWEILAKKSPMNRLTQEILNQVDLMAVSPFELGGPVSDRMFFGRLAEEKTLTRSIKENNFAIVANRKIGKTSLLNRVSRVLSNDNDYRVYTFDLQAVQNYSDFFKKLRSAPPFAQRLENPAAFTPMDFFDITRAVREETPQKALVLIFDEVDDLLDFDSANKTQLFKTARELSQANVCRFIFVGSKILADSLSDANSPFFNFCSVLRLGCLDLSHAEQLVVEPLHEMGITIEHEPQVLQRLLDISAAHPNILQYTCHCLLRLINKENIRTISLAHLDMILRSHEFYEYYTTVLWGQANAYEKLIVYVMMRRALKIFSVADIVSEFDQQQLPTRGLAKALDVLQLYSLVTRTNGSFRFTFSYLKELTSREEQIDEIIEELAEQVRSAQRQSAARVQKEGMP